MRAPDGRDPRRSWVRGSALLLQRRFLFALVLLGFLSRPVVGRLVVAWVLVLPRRGVLSRRGTLEGGIICHGWPLKARHAKIRSGAEGGIVAERLWEAHRRQTRAAVAVLGRLPRLALCAEFHRSR
jgi:hypothetical protein